MELTQQQLESAGYRLPAAPRDTWRAYAERSPVPMYFDFDWLSARHPDLYHAFALSTVGLMAELDRLVDLTGLNVIDVGAGTGRSAMGAARTARTVTAVDIFPGVIAYGKDRLREAGLRNVTYARAHFAHLPFAANSFDALTNAWAELDGSEACRVLKPGGYLIRLGAPLEALCGELTATLAGEYPHLIHEIAPASQFDPACPVEDSLFQVDDWNGLPVTPPVMHHDFTYVADYGDFREAAAIVGRLYGPKARAYLLDRCQSTLAWRLRIELVRVRK